MRRIGTEGTRSSSKVRELYEAVRREHQSPDASSVHYLIASIRLGTEVHRSSRSG
jgi:hypothetical protein